MQVFTVTLRPETATPQHRDTVTPQHAPDTVASHFAFLLLAGGVRTVAGEEEGGHGGQDVGVLHQEAGHDVYAQHEGRGCHVSRIERVVFARARACVCVCVCV